MSDKVVLAYSGGLDTSVILKWLQEKGYEVIAYVADVGQREDFAEVERKALSTGAKSVVIKDLKREFVTDYIFPALWGNAVYEGRYLLGTALARPLIAKTQIEIATELGATHVAHGSTGKGNDQVRFEMAYYALSPAIKVIAPWKNREFLDAFRGRSDMIKYAEQHGIPIKATKSKPYSEDENLMHISHEAGILEDPMLCPAEDVFSLTCNPEQAPDTPEIIEIHFQNGMPYRVVNAAEKRDEEGPLRVFQYLNEVGARHGIGRVDLVENRFVGIKSRGVYETPGATILWLAHRDLECLAMDKEVMKLRDMLSPKFAEIIYNGFWFSPEMDFLLSAFIKSQEAIDGRVVLRLYRGNAYVIGRESPTSLYDPEVASMETQGEYDPLDAHGFIKINALRLRAHHLVLGKQRPYDWRKRR